MTQGAAKVSFRFSGVPSLIQRSCEVDGDHARADVILSQQFAILRRRIPQRRYSRFNISLRKAQYAYLVIIERDTGVFRTEDLTIDAE